MENKPTSDTNADGAGSPGSDQELAAAGLARRRFTKLGAGATGVLMTLASRSGMAQVACDTGSGGVSHGMAYTHEPEVPPTCGGLSPGFYAQNPDGWPSSIPATTTMKFQDIYWVNSTYAILGNMTLMEVFQIGNGKVKKDGPLLAEDPDPCNTGRHFLAAYLNLKSERATVLDEATLKRMWRDYQMTGGGKLGYYEPSATVKWYGAELVNYLTTVTFHNT